MSGPRVLLMRLSCRTSSKGTEYLSGFLGCARVVAFKGKQPDKFGNPQWEVYVAEPEQRQDRPSRDAERGHATHEAVRQRAAEAMPRPDPGQRDTGDPGRPFDDEIPF